MKIWNSHAGEHSTDMRLIGKFKSEEDARKSAELINKLIAVDDKSKKSAYSFSDELQAIFDEYQCYNIQEAELEELEYFLPVEVTGNEIIVDSDEVKVSALAKLIYRYGGKIEIFSRSQYE